MIKKKNKGFTLVEVLICVAIIGIIAAISIPALLVSTSQKALEAQRKALRSRMAQAFSQISNLGTMYNPNNKTNAAATFIFYFQDYYKVTKTCTNVKFPQCGIPDTVYDYYDDKKNPKEIKLSTMTNITNLNTNIPLASWNNSPNVSSAGFKTANGESILVFFNPNCKSKQDADYNIADTVCINMIYDLNGRNQGSNVLGEDIGYMTVFYPDNPTLVMPVINNKKSYTGKFEDMLASATAEDMVPPTLEELISILINQNLAHVTSETGSDGLHWSASYAINDEDKKVWVAGTSNGVKTVDANSATNTYRYYLLRK